jgi:hypothetical protein
MYYRIILSVFITLISGVAGADAENSRYRVEILVLTHLEHDQPPLEAARLEDFSNALDFLTPAPEVEATAAVDGEDRASAVQEPSATNAEVAGLDGTLDGDAAEELACAVVHVAELGPEMQEAWRRLRLSGPFRPLQYLAWEQPGEPPFPALRVHDLESVLTEDPWRDFRENPEDELAGGDAGVHGQEERPAPGTAEDEATEATSGPLPAPIEYFRLDGRMRLVRTRFLHLEVLAELREPVFDPSLAGLQQTAPGAPADPQDAEPRPTSFLVHRLDQRRQVKTGRMEYFDGPVLGVLAFITDISDTLEEEAPSSP